MITSFSLFHLLKTMEREKRRKNQRIMWVWERESCQKVIAK